MLGKQVMSRTCAARYSALLIRVGYVWTGKSDLIRVDTCDTETCGVEIFESGKKKWRIQKYLNTC